MRLAPARVHAHEHRRPVERLRASGTGVDIHYGAELVFVRAEHLPQFELLDALYGRRILRIDLLLGHDTRRHEIGQQLQVLDALSDGLEVVDPAFDVGHLF